MAGDKAEHRRVLKNDPIRAGRKALDIAQLCTLRPLPDPVIQEFDTPLVTLLQAAEAYDPNQGCAAPGWLLLGPARSGAHARL
jgi:hypothetical protein